MGTYNVPRNVKGEGRILFIFSTKALMYTGIGALAGGLFYIIFSLINLTMVGLIFVVLFGLIGFCIGTFKVPNMTKFEVTRINGGENIDEIIKRYAKFKSKKKKIYAHIETKTKEEINNG